MRKPSTHEELYRWHSLALMDSRQPVVAEEPECGWYKMRFVRAGPWVPVEIYCHQLTEGSQLIEPEAMLCKVRGERGFLNRVWPACARFPITKAEHDGLIARKDTEIMRATRKVVDLTDKPMRP